MFAVSRHFSVKEADRAFPLFVNWSVRFLIVGGRGGLLERNYALRAQEIGASTIKTAKDLARALSPIIPNDVAFEQAFAEARVSQDRLARYYLRALEAKKANHTEPEWVPSDDKVAINLEHILPEHPQGNWPHIDPETADAYYKRIGNLVLLQARPNSRIGNASFADKKPILAQSTFLLTSETATHNEWGVDEITDRQRRLAQLAVKTWPTA